MAITAEFSVLLPIYHGDTAQQFLTAFHSCFMRQNVIPAEMVIVRDGAVSAELEDALDELEQEFHAAQLKIIRLPKNQGLVKALNTGLAACSYDTVARMDADDVCAEDRFATQLQAFNSAQLDLIGGGMLEFAEVVQHSTGVRVPPVGMQRIISHAKTHNPFNHPTLIYRKQAVQQLGGYQPMGNMEDYWLVVRMLAAGMKADNIAEPVLHYRVGAGVYNRRGGLKSVVSELKIQAAMLRIGFISFPIFVRNCVFKTGYRLLPAGLKKLLFKKLVASGLPGDRK